MDPVSWLLFKDKSRNPLGHILGIDPVSWLPHKYNNTNPLGHVLGIDPVSWLLNKYNHSSPLGSAVPLMLPFKFLLFQFICVTLWLTQVTPDAVQQSIFNCVQIAGCCVFIPTPKPKLITLGQSLETAYALVMWNIIKMVLNVILDRMGAVSISREMAWLRLAVQWKNPFLSKWNQTCQVNGKSFY